VWDVADGEPVTPPLRQVDVLGRTSRGSVHHVAFSPDGRRIVAAGAGIGSRSAAGAASVWLLPGDGRPTADLLSLVELLGGYRVGAAAGAVAQPVATQLSAWKRLRSSYPANFSAVPGQVLAWHEREAEECLNSDEWKAALAHLDRLIEAQPGRALLRERRARAYAFLNRWRDADADLFMAVKQSPSSEGGAARLEEEVGVSRSNQDRRAALLYLDHLVRADPRNPQIFAGRGDLYTQIGRWVEADNDLSRAVRLGADDIQERGRLALAQLAAGDARGYAKNCAALVAHLKRTSSAEEFRWAAWTSSLSAGASESAARVLRLAEEAALERPYSPWLDEALASALYRARRWQAAAAALRSAAETRVTGTPTSWSPAYARFFLAMAEWRLGRRDEAQTQLRTAVHLTEQELRASLTPPWNRRVTLQLLRREAEAMIRPRNSSASHRHAGLFGRRRKGSAAGPPAP
jgi:tetratricopeptide (TPR) repeat protein